MDSTIPSQERIFLRVRQGKEEHPEYESLLDFWETILSVQASFLPRIPDQGEELPESLIRLKMKEVFPLIPWNTVPKDESLLKELVTALCRATRKSNKNFEQKIPKIETWLQECGPSFSDWVRLLFQEEGKPFLQKAAGQGLDAQVMLFIFSAALKPFLKARSVALAPRLNQTPEEWDQGYCPVCGSSPLLSFFQEDGKRAVVCSACEYEWPIPRFFCPHCQNTDQKTLQYYSIEGDEGHRIEVCELCGCYLKTMDLRKKAGDHLPVLEDLLTTHLDLWAQKKGYKKLPLFGKVLGGGT